MRMPREVASYGQDYVDQEVQPETEANEHRDRRKEPSTDDDDSVETMVTLDDRPAALPALLVRHGSANARRCWPDDFE